MADTKLTGLSASTAASADDLVYLVDDPGGTPSSKKITVDDLMEAADFVLIEEQTPTGTGTVTFSSLGSFTHLEIRFLARGTQAATSTAINVSFNGDNNSGNYDVEVLQGIGNTASSGGTVGANTLAIISIPAASGSADRSAGGTLEIWDYRNTTFHKSCAVRTALRTGTSAATQFMQLVGGGWRSTAAITSIDFVLASGNYVSGTKFSLYGIR